MRLLLTLGLLGLAPGCVVHARGPSVPVPVVLAPASRAMSHDEAVSLGLGQCHSRGYQCELKEAHRTGKDVWKVKFHAWAPGARGHLHLDFDAYSRHLLKVDEKVKARKEKDRDEDDWDDGRGHGRGKGKGKGKRRDD
jgi:hypothetical protein